MTLAEFKANHPEVYAQAANEGATQERDRVGAWMAYADVDLEAVTAGINEGKPLAQKTAAELARKVFSKQALADVTADSPKTLPTGEPTKDEEKTAEQAQVDSWKKEVKAGLKW